MGGIAKKTRPIMSSPSLQFYHSSRITSVTMPFIVCPIPYHKKGKVRRVLNTVLVVFGSNVSNRKFSFAVMKWEILYTWYQNLPLYFSQVQESFNFYWRLYRTFSPAPALHSALAPVYLCTCVAEHYSHQVYFQGCSRHGPGFSSFLASLQGF